VDFQDQRKIHKINSLCRRTYNGSSSNNSNNGNGNTSSNNDSNIVSNLNDGPPPLMRHP
jgi:hypothetical protein